MERGNPGKRGAMMSEIYKKMRTAVFVMLLCAFLSGCGDEEAMVIFPAGDDRPESAIQSDVPGGADTLQGTEAINVKEKNGIYVYVCGAVASPGVVELPEGSRAADALEAAMGFAENAQTDYVNLAAKVEDGEKLYFPTQEEAQEMTRTADVGKSGLVNINTAGREQLLTLPGIGSARAEDIISYREKNGAFRTTEDIMKVPGIKSAAYEKLKDKITTE